MGSDLDTNCLTLTDVIPDWNKGNNWKINSKCSVFWLVTFNFTGIINVCPFTCFALVEAGLVTGPLCPSAHTHKWILDRYFKFPKFAYKGS